MIEKISEQKKIQEKLAAFPEAHFLHSPQSKAETLLVTSLLGGPFVLLLVFMGRAGQAPLWPLVAATVLLVGWALFVGIGHRSISEEDFLALPPDDQIHRLFYESFWWRLYQGGFAFFASGALVWGATEIMIRFEFITLLPLFLGMYLLFLIFCLIKHQWVAKFYSEGNKKHKWLKPLIAVTFGITGLMPILGGVARTLQVSKGNEATLQIFGPVFAGGILMLATTLMILGILALHIAHAQYQAWKQMRTNIFPS